MAYSTHEWFTVVHVKRMTNTTLRLIFKIVLNTEYKPCPNAHESVLQVTATTADTKHYC